MRAVALQSQPRWQGHCSLRKHSNEDAAWRSLLSGFLLQAPCLFLLALHAASFSMVVLRPLLHHLTWRLRLLASASSSFAPPHMPL
mmetsp:Transcript_8877/g.19347  ORF Transcript_8877/g.19347 Transcript_8877/m.19347 type:complete len:86 (+) Transcript_8877:482-739(+)